MFEKELLYSDTIENLIRKRISVRTYSGGPLPAELREKITAYASGLKGPFDAPMRFELLDSGEAKEKNGVKLGMYGMIAGAGTFIAAVTKREEKHAMEQLGYVFEDLVLYATSLGLGTCWLAGTFNKGSFSKAVNLSPDEFLPIVIPVGFPAGFRSPVDFLMKPVRTAKKRKDWKELFFSGDFNKPLGPAEAGAYSLPLEMTRLAPSASNRQPWRIVASNGNFHFYIAHTPFYDRMYPYDIQKIDMGIAMFHFEGTAREASLKGKWDFIAPSPAGLPSNCEYIATWVSLQSAA